MKNLLDYSEFSLNELINKISLSRYWNLPKMVAEALRRLVPQEPKYKVYTALLSQSGTDAPVAIVLENTLGDIIFNSLDGINNTIQSNNLFTENKTYVYIGNANDPTFNPQKTIDNSSTISFTVSTSGDAMLNTPIEIRVYN